MDEEGNIVPGKMIDMVVDGNEVYIVGRPMLQGDRLTDVYVGSAMDQRCIYLTSRQRLPLRFRGRGLCPWWVGSWEESSQAKGWLKRATKEASPVAAVQ